MKYASAICPAGAPPIYLQRTIAITSLAYYQPCTMPTETVYPTRGRRLLITSSVILVTMMVALDTTIANVALPQMQSSLSASPEQVVWVLTSYLLASAIMTPLSSWLASRYGRKRVMGISALIFTFSSLACGLAGSLEFMIFARLVQGISGAGLIPLGQATLLDINPPAKQGQAMAMVGLGAMLGPLAGPTLGGYLTDAMSWRWVFLINIPLGVIATIGIGMYMTETREKGMSRFDIMGFATLSIFLASLQLMMDRGQQLDWFDSVEIWIEAGLMLLFGYLTVVHMITAKNTFVRGEIFLDRNYALGTVVSIIIGIVAFATIPIITIMMQTLLGYSALETGLVSMPRGAGTVVGLIIVSRLIGRIDARILLFFGLLLTAASLYLYSQISLGVDEAPLLFAGLLQGFAGGMMISPLATISFATLAPKYRNEGSAIYSLARNIGSSLGISAMQMFALNDSARVAGQLAENVRPDNPTFAAAMPDFEFGAIQSMFRIAREISRQSAMVATVDTLWMACLLAIATLPVALLMKTQSRAGAKGG